MFLHCVSFEPCFTSRFCRASGEPWLTVCDPPPVASTGLEGRGRWGGSGHEVFQVGEVGQKGLGRQGGGGTGTQQICW